LGANLSRVIGKSVRSPGSYSIVVRAPVDPGTNRAATPFFQLGRINYSLGLVGNVKNLSFAAGPKPQLLRLDGRDLPVCFRQGIKNET
jgi:hypothetical protein